MIFYADYGSKVVKFSNNDRLDMLILLARDEQFLIPHWKRFKGGPLEDFSYFLTGRESTSFLDFDIFLTSHLQNNKISPCIGMPEHIGHLFM